MTNEGMSIQMAEESKPLALEHFNNTIVRPMVIDGIKSGRFDIVLNSVEERIKCICVYSRDIEILSAIIDRLKVLGVK